MSRWCMTTRPCELELRGRRHLPTTKLLPCPPPAHRMHRRAQPVSSIIAKLEPLGFSADMVTAALQVLGETANPAAVVEYLLCEENGSASHVPSFTRSRAGAASSDSRERSNIEVQLRTMGFSTAQIAAAQRAVAGWSLRDMTEYLLKSAEPTPAPAPRDARAELMRELRSENFSQVLCVRMLLSVCVRVRACARARTAV